MDARTRRALKQRHHQIQHYRSTHGAVDFFNTLTGPQLLELTESQLPEHRERLYPPTVTLSLFLGQCLSADRSCQQAVNGWLAQRLSQGLKGHSLSTGGYCKARLRLPQPMISALVQGTGRMLSEAAECAWRWQGRAVKLLDGTTVSAPDTCSTQQRYPQSSLQAVGVGFPLLRVVGVICLSTGAVLDAAVGGCVGEGASELALLRQLYAALQPGDVALGDALYCNYFVICALRERGVDMVCELQGGRRADFRRGERLGKEDHLVCWPRPRQPPWMSRQQYESLPEQLVLRESRVKGRVLVSTMGDARAVPKAQLFELYAQRWQVELDLRNIKAVLGMRVLSGMSAQMNEKQIWVYLLAYNLIRMLMASAARQVQCHPRQLSFKHTLQLWMHWRDRGLLAHPDHILQLLLAIAQRRCGHRAGRKEPRARKRRPHPYPWLQVPRSEHPHHAAA